MKKFLTILLTLGLVFAFNASAQMDNSFTYQGELLDNGSPANGEYDIQVVMLDGSAQQVGVTSQHNAVQVTNGQFSLNVSFGIAMFDGYENYYFEVSVRKTSVGGAYTTLSPLQQLQSVPLASNLVNGNAAAGQVLTFNGFQWAPAAPSATTPWSVNGGEIYTNENVGIGTDNPAYPLHIDSNATALYIDSNATVPAKFDGGNQFYIPFAENGLSRGYIGSFQPPNGGSITDADFEIGTYSGTGGNFHITTGSNNPRVTVDAAGLVGVGTTIPGARLHVQGNSVLDPYLFRVSNSASSTTKFVVDNNGGAAIGSLAIPPSNGLSVAGDVKQPSSSDGMMKYMVNLTCGSSNSNIERFYNGTTTAGDVTVTNGSILGQCIVNFPTNINNRYWVAHAFFGPGDARGVSCSPGTSNDQLICMRYNISDGSGNSGEINLLVY